MKKEKLEWESVTYAIGDRIQVDCDGVYDGLYGVIVEIQDGEDKETENETPDIYCNLEIPVLSNEIAKYERKFSALYGEEIEMVMVNLDSVIFAPDMIRVAEPVRNSTLVSIVREILGGKQTIKIFSKREDAIDWFHQRLNHEYTMGVIGDLIWEDDFICRDSSTSYECWGKGGHYSIFLEDASMIS